MHLGGGEQPALHDLPHRASFGRRHLPQADFCLIAQSHAERDLRPSAVPELKMMLEVVQPAKPSDLKGLVVVLVVSFDLPTTSDPNFARASYENTSLERILDSADGLTP